jgi:predicted permease
MLLLNIFVNNILPVLLLSGTGFALEKTLHVDARPLGRVIFYILSPVLVFNLHTSNELPFDRIGLMVGFTATGSLIISGLAFLIGKLFRLDRGALIIVIVTSMCVNAGNLCHPAGNAFSLYEMELA